MTAELIPDDFWKLIEPLLMPQKSNPKGGRPRLPDRVCLKGILFVLRSGIPWEMLPKELGCGSGMACWRRLRDWQEAGIWDFMHFTLLDWLSRYSRIDWSRASRGQLFDASGFWGQRTGPTNSQQLIEMTRSRHLRWLTPSHRYRGNEVARGVVLIA